MSDYAKTITNIWSAQGKAMLDAQEKAARAITEGMKTMLAGLAAVAAGERTELGAVTAELGQASDALMQLWSAATNLSSEFAGKLPKYVRGSGDGITAAVFEHITDPRQWMSGIGDLDDVMTRTAEGPRLADLWHLERRYAQVMKTWTELGWRTFEHQRIVLEGWIRAGQRFWEELSSRSSAGANSLEPKRALQLWTEVANRQLLETQHSEPFLQSQRALIRASTELRIAQVELIEHFGKQYGFPTRTELDDVHRTLTEMRRELRRVRRALDEAQADRSVPPGSTPPEPAPLPSETPETVADASQLLPKRKAVR